MPFNDKPGDHFKALERDMETALPKRSIFGIRLDGKSFHTFTKGFDRPFDRVLMNAMDKTADAVSKRVFAGNALMAFVQSDEITIVFTDKIGPRTELVLGGRLSKILSVSSAVASVNFMKAIPNEHIKPGAEPVFDARLFKLGSIEEALDNIHWRRLDARKNAVTMIASTVRSPKELHGVSTEERIGLLGEAAFDRIPEDFFNGRLIVNGEVMDATRENTENLFDSFELFD